MVFFSEFYFYDIKYFFSILNITILNTFLAF